MGTPREDRDCTPHCGVEGSDRFEIEFPQFLLIPDMSEFPEFIGFKPRLEREKARGVEGSEGREGIPGIPPPSPELPGTPQGVPPPSEGVEGNPVGLRAERVPEWAQGVPGSDGIVGNGRSRSWKEERVEARGVLGSICLGGMVRRFRLRAPFLRVEIEPEIGLESGPRLRLSEPGPRSGPDTEGRPVRRERPQLRDAEPGPEPEPGPVPVPGSAVEPEAMPEAEAKEDPGAGADSGAEVGREAALWL